MSRPGAPVSRRGRGNPNWGRPPAPLPVLLMEFEMVERLELTQAEYVASTQLRHWCAHNRNRCYIPEWLLREWGMTVEGIFSGVA